MNPFAPPLAFHIMTKPTGAICNIGCKYCFYLEKEKLYPDNRNFFMKEETLREYVKQYITSQDVDEIAFAWQGGEPTLLGVDFFEKAVAFQREFLPPGKTVSNAFQTNGILLDDRWGAFLAREKFLVGLSIDGPERIHNKYRVTKGGDPTFSKVMAGLEILKKHKVEFNTLTVVNRENSKYPLEVYRFLRENGSGFIQFIPLVERRGDGEFLAKPALLPGGQVGDETRSPVTDWSVRTGDFGQFLCDIWDEWVRHDVGKTFVQLFDVQLGLWAGQPSSICVFSETCGKALAMEHNGDLYSCDHFVYPEYKLGNLFNQSLGDMVQGAFQTRFGTDKRDTLPPMCRACEFRFACHGECPKHRFMKTPEGDDGLNYLCGAYLKFFRHAGPHLNLMVDLLRQRRPPAEIMDILAKQKEQKAASQSSQEIGRNDPCPCGSGKKYKACHGIAT